MHVCSFVLNGKPLSNLTIKTLPKVAFPAFSGLGASANKRELMCIKGTGPIPAGQYYIFERESGGRLGFIRDLFSGRGEWFALYAVDGAIDDQTYCNQVARGNFRLHPKGPLGRSEGCITIEKAEDFRRLRAILTAREPTQVEGTSFKAYGKVVVT